MKRLRRKIALAGLFVAGCQSPPSVLVDAGDQTKSDLVVATARTFAEIREGVFVPTCAAGAACHSPLGSITSGLDLATDPYRSLIGVTATNAEAATQGLSRVKPCDPDVSFLWIKLDLFDPRYQGHRYGSPMPLDRSPLLDAQKLAVRDWIERGALEEEPPVAAGGNCPIDGGRPDAD